MEWLGDEAKDIAVPGYILLAGLISLSLSQVVSEALINLGILPPPRVGAVDPLIKYMNVFILVEMLVIWPIMEEIIFRFLPLAMVISFISSSPRFVFGVSSFFAVLFGTIHPYGLPGKIDVAIAGFMFSLIFLKCGGLTKHFRKATIAAIAAHTASNAFLLLYKWWEALQK